MYCIYCGSLLDSQAKFCPVCGKRVNGNASMNKIFLANVISVVLILFIFYGYYADALTITDEGELNPLGFVILFLLAGSAVVLYKTRIYLFNLICYGVLSIIYLIRIINLQEVLEDKYGRYIDFDSFKFLYWMYLITLAVLTVVLAIKYVHENNNENLLLKLANLKSRLKNAKAISADEMNDIVLSGIRKKSIIIIGLISCLFWVFLTLNSMKHQSINIYLVLLLISNVFIGLFLYAIYSSISRERPFIRLGQGFVILILAFLIVLGLDIRQLIVWDYAKYLTISILIRSVFGVVLCFHLFRLCRGFQGKQNTAQLEISMIASMVCLCMMLVMDKLADYFFYYYYNKKYYYGSPFSQFRDYGEAILKQSLKSKALMITPIILSIVLVLLFRNILRSLKTLAIHKQMKEEVLQESSSAMQQ